MVDEPEAQRLDTEEEEEGGPVKSFLEHLEDLRWVLIKSIAAAGVAAIVCFFAGNYIFRVLRWPLDRAPISKSSKDQIVRLMAGTNQLQVFHVATNDLWSPLVGTNRYVRLNLTPITFLETNHVSVETEPKPPSGQSSVDIVRTNHVLGFTIETEAKPPPGESPIDIVSLGPVSAFIVATKIALYGGLTVASPFIFYFVSAFVFPALRMREKKYVYQGLGFGLGLFLVGVAFCYFVLMPVALAVSAQYAEWFGFKANQWRAEEYIGFVCKFMLGMGLGFEMPVVLLTLVKLGILSYGMLKAARRYVIVIAFVLGAILTTPEVITQVLMAIPLLFLYEVSVWVAWYWERQEKKREAAGALAERA